MKTAEPTVAEIADIARRARIHILKAVAHAKGGHVGGPYSAIDMLAALYFRVLEVRPDEPDWPDRDRFVLSKGHSSIALYTILAMRGFFDVEELATFDSIDSRLQGHPDMTITPGVDMSSGSLGLGFAGALGIALGGRALGKDFTTYVMLGDGECNEGVVWEGAHVANRYHLDRLVAIIDQNNLQQFGWRGDTETERLTPYVGDELAGRWRAFGWHVLEVDGHDIQAFLNTVEKARAVSGSPVAIVAHTIKGKGVSYMEDNYTWHARVPTEEEFAVAMRELGDTKAGER
ncbi:MAG TPA: transketolase [Actinobacteria bacterium]|nr:transketolase 2 [bacterium BMS3Bbin01]HDH26885.1 transketolase [Actinomycetota bacterium]HDL48913.1 transketolase [Actinomycetota bacterium]